MGDALKLRTWILIGFACVLLVGIGCDSRYDVSITQPPLSPPALSISPTSITVTSCGSTDIAYPSEAIFTASGGTPPYSWSNSGGGTFEPDYGKDNTMARWTDPSGTYCGANPIPAIQITVTDADSATAAADLVPFNAGNGD